MRFVKDNVVSTVATLATGLLMFGLQFYGGHHLSPGDYGRAFALFGFYGIVTRPGSSFGRQVAWHVSRRSEVDSSRPSLADSVLLRLTLWLFTAGILIGLVSTLYSGTLASFFHATRTEILTVAWGSPFLLAIQSLKGALEGERRFLTWSAVNVLVPLLYLVGVVSLISNYKVMGVLTALTSGSVIAFLVCLATVRQSIVRALRVPMRVPWRTDLPFVTNGVFATLTNGVFLSADVVTVQHYLSHRVSGQYAIVAAIGNILFSGTTGILNVMFPHVAERQHKGQSSKPIVFTVIGVFTIGTIIGAILLQILGTPIIRQFAGPKYVGGASYLGWYAVGMGILSWSTALMHTQQARNRFTLLWALIPALVMRLLMLVLFHSSPLQVVLISDALALSFALVLFVMFLHDENTMLRQVRARSTETNEIISTADQTGDQ